MMYLLVCVIVFSSGYVGTLIYNKYKNRSVFYETMVKFADFLILNIYHLNDDVGSIFDKFSSSLEPKYAKDFESIKEQIVSDKLSNEFLFGLKMCVDLKSQEKKQVLEFLNSIGKSNTESQIHMLEGYKEVFKSGLGQAIDEQKMKGSIAMKIAVSVGVVICILIV